MKVFWLHFLKNFVFFILKLLIITLFCLQCFSLGVSHFDNIKSGYSNYTDLRGKSNWMTEGVAQLIREDNNYGIYNYIVNEVDYTLKIDKKSVEVIDETVKIVYDNNVPDVVITEYDLSKIDSFYTDSLKTICLYYIEVFALVIVLGLCWFLLDYLKYNKSLWGLYV